MSARRAARRRTCAAIGIPQYLGDIRPVRGRCTATVGRGRRVCGARYGVMRVSVDLTDARRTDRLVTVECATCGHVWRRIPGAVDIAPDGYQSVRLTLLLPADERRWYARGRWHHEGESGVVRDATLAEYMAAVEDWRRRHATVERAKAREAARKAAEATAAHERTAALLERLHAQDAARAAEEAAAAAREAAA